VDVIYVLSIIFGVQNYFWTAEIFIIISKLLNGNCMNEW